MITCPPSNGGFLPSWSLDLGEMSSRLPPAMNFFPLEMHKVKAHQSYSHYRANLSFASCPKACTVPYHILQEFIHIVKRFKPYVWYHVSLGQLVGLPRDGIALISPSMTPPLRIEL